MQLPRSAPIRYEYVVAFVYSAGLFMEIMDTTIVNVALETLAHDLHTSTGSIEWVVLGYLLSLAMWIPASGWIADRFGTKRTMLVSLGVFTAASALCGLAVNIEQLVAFRILQGVGGGMLTPVGLTMLFRAFPPERRAKAATVLMIPTVVAPATGPVIGGLLVDRASWHWIFFVNVPIGVATFAVAALYLNEHRERSESPFDVPGFVLSGGALASMLYALTEGPSQGWGSAPIVAGALIGVSAAVLLAWWELRVEHPMLDLRLLHRRLFGLCNLTQAFVHASFLGLLFLVALFLQQARGLSPLATGLTVFPEAVGVVVSAQVIGRIYPRVGPRRVMGCGLIGSAIVMASFATIDADTSLWTVRLMMFAAGATVACSFVSLQVGTFAAVSQSDSGQASAIFTTLGHAGAAVGVALGATTVSTVLPNSADPSSAQVYRAFHAAFFVVAALALVGAAVAWQIPRQRRIVDVATIEAVGRRRPRRRAGRHVAVNAVARTELGDEPAGHGQLVGSLCHLSDLHVMDAASPMRFEWIETLAHDPRWRPLLHMHRPQETLVPWAVAAHVDALRSDPTGASRHAPLDLVVCTGDNIDNAQRNELDAYLALIAGGTSTLSPIGSAQDADDGEPGNDGMWPYWSPLPHVIDSWKPRGYPVVADLLDRASEPLTSPGLGMAWTSLPGNHDVLCQGTSFVNDTLNAAATGARKGLWPPPGFVPDEPLSLFVDAPELFLGSGDRQVEAQPDRRGVTRHEWIQRHVQSGAAGMTTDNVTQQSTDAVIALPGLTVITLDTNHPDGDYQGSVGSSQLQWLDDQLTRAGSDDRLVVLASHHGVDTLVNTRGNDPSRHLAADMLQVVHRHPCVVAWLVGHRHTHRVTPRPGASGGFWEITTASIIDWPVERRSIEVLRHTNGTVELVSTVQQHGAAADSLAGIHRQVAERFGGSQVRSAMAGATTDRDVRLFLER